MVEWPADTGVLAWKRFPPQLHMFQAGLSSYRTTIRVWQPVRLAPISGVVVLAPAAARDGTMTETL